MTRTVEQEIGAVSGRVGMYEYRRIFADVIVYIFPH